MSNATHTTVFDHVDLAAADLLAVHGGQSRREVPDPEQRTPMPSRRQRDPEPQRRRDRDSFPQRPGVKDLWDRVTKPWKDPDPPHSGTR